MKAHHWLAATGFWAGLVASFTTFAQAPLSAVQARSALKALGATEDTIALNGLYGNLEPATQIASSLLGVGAQSVSTPGGLQDVSLSVLQSFSNFPAKGSGVGIEFSPVQLWEKTHYQPTKRDSAVARILGMKPLQRDTVAYRSLAEYRRTFWRRGFVLSAASVSDSIAGRLAGGVSYTFGTRQLDPFTARGYSEALTVNIQNQLTSKRGIAKVNAINAGFIKQRRIAIDLAMRDAGLQLSSFNSSNDYSKFLDPITDQTLALPQLNSTNPTDTSATALLAKYGSTGQLRKQITEYLGRQKILELTPEQENLFVNSLEKNLFSELRQAVMDYQTAAKPLFQDVGLLLKTAAQDFERRNWNAPLLQIGTGYVWRSPDHSWNALAGESFHGFLRAATRPGKSWGELAQHAQVVGNLQYVHHALDSLRQQVLVGVRVLVGNERIRLSAESSWKYQAYREREGKTHAADVVKRYTVGVETRVADNLWLEIAIGRTNASPTGPIGDKAGMLALADLKYGFRSRRRFVVP
jgi:hypothetical protein